MALVSLASAYLRDESSASLGLDKAIGGKPEQTFRHPGLEYAQVQIGDHCLSTPDSPTHFYMWTNSSALNIFPDLKVLHNPSPSSLAPPGLILNTLSHCQTQSHSLEMGVQSEPSLPCL